MNIPQELLDLLHRKRELSEIHYLILSGQWVRMGNLEATVEGIKAEVEHLDREINSQIALIIK